MELSKLEQIIGYEFCDKELLPRAMTHSSYANEKLGSPGEGNERLEFLGDAVLGACVGLQLYNRYADKEEGFLTKMRASIVCERSLGTAGKKLGINEFLLLSKGEESGGGRDRISIIADCMEAIIAATRTGAEIIRKEHKVGTLEAGKLADITVCAGNPLADIRVLTDIDNIKLVIQDGRIVKNIL